MLTADPNRPGIIRLCPEQIICISNLILKQRKYFNHSGLMFRKTGIFRERIMQTGLTGKCPGCIQAIRANPEWEVIMRLVQLLGRYHGIRLSGAAITMIQKEAWDPMFLPLSEGALDSLGLLCKREYSRYIQRRHNKFWRIDSQRI